jgi:alpha-galactosidase
MLHHLRAAGVGVVVDARGAGAPALVHWGRDLGPLADDDLAAVVDARVPAVPPSSVDSPLRVSLLPGLAEGWSGRPAVVTHRPGGSATPGWRARTAAGTDAAVSTSAAADADTAGGRLVVEARDDVDGVRVRTELELTPQGVLRLRHTVGNDGPSLLEVDAAHVVVPVPDRAREVLDFAGLWSHERSPQRHALPVGTWLRETRHGRPGHDGPFLLVAGTPGFGMRSGEVWAAHLAWSGDGAWWVERSTLGVTTIGAGELLAPGEVALAPGEEYVSPWTVLVWSGDGLDGVSDRLHPWIRSWDAVPRPRPVILNTWEAVYFEQSLEGLRPLVEAAESVGVERFVLDDGWFRGRHDATRALGDWYVDPGTWPDGLGPLADLVAAHGMELGLWVEPEMVSLDSDLARAHPDWVLGRPDALLWRDQRVLDLSVPAAWEHVRDRLLALLDEYPIAYLKWDHNRDVLDASAHAQTDALYRLLDALRTARPGVEIESCASGGARIDLGVLPRVARVWTSDTNDPLERQTIQRWTGLVVPPEYLGSHLGAERAHTTARAANLSFRMITALFGSAGIEWDLTQASDDELAAVRAWIDLYKAERSLLHGGTVVRADPSDAAWLAHGVVSPDRSRALFAVVALGTADASRPAPVRLPGLDPDRRYRVSPVELGDGPAVGQAAPPPWWAAGRVVLPGAALEETGLAVPLLAPENALLLRVEEED